MSCNIFGLRIWVIAISRSLGVVSDGGTGLVRKIIVLLRIGCVTKAWYRCVIVVCSPDTARTDELFFGHSNTRENP